ncbi:hypothetical protein BV25DRAFT_1918846 [Artomyces pyxidatus]|uniref:Uncharacterized protein n=1 Tax=Artomyces pyxidatus TaxID=48021 RepID=A0ACB8SRS4_9AGAM|nr:hypothetical protein BV25DRAFT_1918846 [Artomyces pyxidatus]
MSDKPDAPYVDGDPLPQLKDTPSAVVVQWILTDLQEEDLSRCRYRPEGSTRAFRGKTAVVGRARNVFVRGPAAPGSRSMAPGDVWMNTDSPSAVWVSLGEGIWAEWQGNAFTESLEHPSLPGRHLWFCFANEFSWVKKRSLTSKRSSWRKSGHGSAEFMCGRGRVNESGLPLQAIVEDVAAILRVPRSERSEYIKNCHSNRPSKRRKLSAAPAPLSPHPIDSRPDDGQTPSAELATDRDQFVVGAGSSIEVSSTGTAPDRFPPLSGEFSSPELTLFDDDRTNGVESTLWPNSSASRLIPAPASVGVAASTDAGVSDLTSTSHQDLSTTAAGDTSPSISTPTFADASTSTDEDVNDSASTSHQDLSTIAPSRTAPYISVPTSVDASTSTDQDANGITSTSHQDLSTDGPLDPSKSLSAGRFWDDLEEKQWPQSAESIKWRSGVTTVAPYAGILMNEASTFEDADVNAVEVMAQAWDAREGNESQETPFIFLQWDPSQLDDLGDHIADALSRNRTVVVEGWTFEGPPILYNEKGLTRLRGSLRVPIQYHCAAKRIQNRSSREKNPVPHVRTSLGKFLQLSKTQDACGNLMDSLQVDGGAPPFIEAVSDDVWAWKTTCREGYEEEGVKLQSQVKKGSVKARKKAMEAARQAGEDPAADEVGPRIATIDSFNFRHWDLVTMAGFFTWPHHDANGLCTWASVRDGAKIWGMIRFRDNRTATCTSRKDMMRLFEKALTSGAAQSHETSDYEIFVTILERGSTIIMPPCAWHEVYTPWSRVYDHKDHFATNADHVGFRRTLARMSLALRYLDRPLKKRAFLALASMVKNEGEYIAAGHDKEPAGARYEDDIEMVVAFRIIMDLCRVHDISLEDAENNALLVGGGWDDPGSENLSLDAILFDL